MTTYIPKTGHGNLVGDDGVNYFRPDIGEKSSINGFGGKDGVGIYGRDRSDYIMHIEGDFVSLENKSTGEVDFVLTNIERIEFDDIRIALDDDGAAGKVYRLYTAAFNRTPDPDGYTYWLAQIDQFEEEFLSYLGKSLPSIASNFVASKEFETVYGADATNESFVTKLYQHVFNRNGNGAEISYWTNRLDAGASRADLLINFSESPEYVAILAPYISDGIIY